MRRRLLLIVGLQKSGTTLLARLLQQSGLASNPFDGEGNEFWGNEPPFAPQGDPSGVLYQAKRGDAGHALEAGDANPEMARRMTERLAAIAPGDAAILNKNPYNSVRIPWLRALFPEACIVSMVRAPLANVFSLVKKFTPHKQSGLAPEEGWWGVKPRGWRALVRSDKVLQCASQWSAVNGYVARDRRLLDGVYGYADLCARPAHVVAEIAGLCGWPLTDSARALAPLPSFDDEYRRGSRLRSKNRYFKERGDLSVPEAEPVEIAAFTSEQVASIEKHSAETAALLADVL